MLFGGLVDRSPIKDGVTLIRDDDLLIGAGGRLERVASASQRFTISVAARHMSASGIIPASGYREGGVTGPATTGGASAPPSRRQILDYHSPVLFQLL